MENAHYHIISASSGVRGGECVISTTKLKIVVTIILVGDPKVVMNQGNQSKI